MPDQDQQFDQRTHHELEFDRPVAANIGLTESDLELIAGHDGDDAITEAGIALLPADVEEADRKAHLNEHQIALRRLQDAAVSYRKSQTKTFLAQIERVQKLCALVENKEHRIAIMTRDWRISRLEALRLHRLREIPNDLMVVYGEALVTPEMIAALQKAKPDVREEAHVLIAAGRILHPADLAQMRNRRRAADPTIRRSLDQKFLQTQIAAAGADRLSVFKEQLAHMVRLLALAYDKTWEGGSERRMEFLRATAIAAAANLGAEFDALFPQNLPTVTSWHYSDRRDRNIHLAKVRLTLDRMAKGDFRITDLAESDGGYIEKTLVEALAWLCDVDVSHLRYRTDSNPNYHDDDEFAGFQSDIDEPPVLTSLEICAGAGGAAIGLHTAGFSSVGLIERDAHAVKTLIANHQLGPIIYQDVRRIKYESYVGKIDLFAGGVPCQPHSALGNQQGASDERDLFSESVNLIRLIQPRAVVLENVAAFSHRQAASYRAKIFADLHDAGYDAELFTIRASDYGLGQARPRLVLVAMRDGLLSKFKLPPIMSPEPVTVGDALRDLMAENGWPGAANWAGLAQGSAPTIVGGSEKSGRQGFSSRFQLERWAELSVDASTIADHAPDASTPYNHMPRLTLRMGAKLQGFPEAWTFKGPKREQRRQIANALPPIMACAIGLAIREALTGEPVDYKHQLSQARIETTGILRGSASTAIRTANDLDLPSGDAHTKAINDGFKKHWVPNQKGRGKPRLPEFFSKYAKLDR